MDLNETMAELRAQRGKLESVINELVHLKDGIGKIQGRGKLTKADEGAPNTFKSVARSPGAVVGGFDSHTPLPRIYKRFSVTLQDATAELQVTTLMV